jgi:glyoxylase-like metal-dependent hydrolase (beta-lactamase superfamily II)
MIAKPIVPGIYMIPISIVNAFLIDDNGLTLIDTGIAGSSTRILQAVNELGKSPADVRRILITHCHSDHSGSLAELKRLTGATVYMHALDAALVRNGQSSRPTHPSPGLLGTLMGAFMNRGGPSQVAAAEVDVELEDGQEINGTSGLRTVYTPGHTAGHVVFVWPKEGGVLFVGDAASHMLRLGYSPIYEDPEEGRRSLAKIADLKFGIACFAHGKPILKDAVAQFAQFRSGESANPR